MNTDNTWTPFWFEANDAWGLIDSPAEWDRIVAAHGEGVNLMRARRGPDHRTSKISGPIPNYGFRAEHRGDETLAEHFLAQAQAELLAIKARGEEPAASEVGPIEDAKAKNSLPPGGTPCRTTATLGSTTGMLIAQYRLDARAPDTDGVTRGWVAGHGGDVWWVEHDDGSVGAYMFNEVTDRPGILPALDG